MSDSSLPPEERKAVYDQQKALAAQHLPQLCYELSQWRKTGILPNGLLRDIGEVLDAVDPMYKTRLAEQMVVDLCIESFSQQWVMSTTQGAQ